MCQTLAEGGDRCAAETGGVCQDKRDKYEAAYPEGPAVDPVSEVSARFPVSAGAIQPVPALIKPPPDSHAVWIIHADGQIELYGAYKTADEQRQACQDAQEELPDARVLARPGAWTSRDVEHAALQRQISDEREGRGPSPRHTSDHMVLTAPSQDVLDAYGLIGVDSTFPLGEDEGDGVWGTFGQELTLEPDDQLHTTQEWVSGTHVGALVEQMGDQTGTYVRGQSNHFSELPSLYRDEGGKLWVLDGHHSIMAARDRGRSVRAMVISHTQMPAVHAWADDLDDYDDDW